jgi:tetratricopeptide (TPR) repeat protein
MFDRQRAFTANERGKRLADAGDDNAAEVAYGRAIELDASFESAWFNLGLVFKRRHDWVECRRCNLRAAELDPRKGQPAWWNLGIAATALGHWDTARRAWRGSGSRFSREAVRSRRKSVAHRS